MHVFFKVGDKWVGRLSHRIIASCFLDNPSDLPEVNHKNCCRSDNRVSNLEWCSNLYNQHYREKYGVSMTESQGHYTFAVDLGSLKVFFFRSQAEASKTIGADDGKINYVIKGKRNKTHNYWFTNADNNAINDAKNRLYKMIGDKIKEITAGDNSKEVAEFINGLNN